MKPSFFMYLGIMWFNHQYAVAVTRKFWSHCFHTWPVDWYGLEHYYIRWRTRWANLVIKLLTEIPGPQIAKNLYIVSHCGLYIKTRLLIFFSWALHLLCVEVYLPQIYGKSKGLALRFQKLKFLSYCYFWLLPPSQPLPWSSGWGG